MIVTDSKGRKFHRTFVMTINNDGFTDCIGISESLNEAMGMIFNHFLDSREDDDQKITITDHVDSDNGSWLEYVCKYEGNDLITDHIFMYLLDEEIKNPYDDYSRINRRLEWQTRDHEEEEYNGYK